jgi:RimJ/RimL family protein N-acetyltransferase
MSIQVVIDADGVYRFIKEMGAEVPRAADQQGIGLEKNGELVGGVLYERFDGRNIWMHCAGSGRWITRDLLSAAFRYPFIQLGCHAVWGWVEAENTKARRLDEHLGFKQHAIIPAGSKTGGDVIIYRMTREECRFLRED